MPAAVASSTKAKQRFKREDIAMTDKTMSLKTQRISLITQQIDQHALKIAEYQEQMIRLTMFRPALSDSTIDNPFKHPLTPADEMTQLLTLVTLEQSNIRRLIIQLMLDLGIEAEFNALHQVPDRLS